MELMTTFVSVKIYFCYEMVLKSISFITLIRIQLVFVIIVSDSEKCFLFSYITCVLHYFFYK